MQARALPSARWLVALGVVVLFVPGTSTATAGRSPLVRLAAAAPLTLAGSGFAPLERVRLAVELRGVTHRVTVRAGPHGRFSHRFALARGRCDPLSVVARGSTGSRASWALNVPDCSQRD